jgi:hypothetical protein
MRKEGSDADADGYAAVLSVFTFCTVQPSLLDSKMLAETYIGVMICSNQHFSWVAICQNTIRTTHGVGLTVKARPMRKPRFFEIHVRTAILAPSLKCQLMMSVAEGSHEYKLVKYVRCTFKELVKDDNNQQRHPAVTRVGA